MIKGIGFAIGFFAFAIMVVTLVLFGDQTAMGQAADTLEGEVKQRVASFSQSQETTEEEATEEETTEEETPVVNNHYNDYRNDVQVNPSIRVDPRFSNDIGVTHLNAISQSEEHRVPVQNYPQLRKSYDIVKIPPVFNHTPQWV
jgi:Sec-independent protein translocase protein TatA